MITGLTLDDSLNDLAAKFNVTLEVRHTGDSAFVEQQFSDISSGHRASDTSHRG